jgi:hypothetical protein
LEGLTGVRKNGEGDVSNEDPCNNAQGCKVTGNWRQFVLDEQIFREKEIDCAPRHIKMRLPLTIFAVIQRTGVDDTTSK